MEVIVNRSAGLDVHRSVIVGCVIWTSPKGRLGKAVETFPTTAAGLNQLAGWLKGHAVEAVGMESTGVYWKPAYAVLEAEGSFDLIVANAQHIKAVPGRKTDVKDAEWLAQLVRCGLVRKSFVPAHPIRTLRDLTRYRRTLIEAQASDRARLIKLLEATDMKLAGVLSDVLGVSGRAILEALIEGELPAAEIAKLAKGRLRKKRAALTEALGGTLLVHHRELLAMQLARINATEATIEALDAKIAEHLEPYDTYMKLLVEMPGIDWRVASTIIAEIGVDMSMFPTAGHLAAWSGTCPGNNQSASKTKAAPARKGNSYLKTTLCNAAISAARTKDSFFKAKYYALKSRRGGGRAAMAIAHKLLVCIYHIFTTGTPYRDLGRNYHDKRDTQRAAMRHVRRLQNLGFDVIIQQTAQPAAS